AGSPLEMSTRLPDEMNLALFMFQEPMPSLIALKLLAHGLRLVATCPLAALTYLILRACSGDEV
ncbi:MAG: hypothetical protein ACXVBV_21365, partial [Isosphaeraceae bacterium]